MSGTTRTLCAAAVGAALGALVTFLAMSRDAPEETAAARTADAKPAHAVSSASAARDDVAAKPASPRAAAREAAPAAKTSLAALLDEIAIDVPPPGTGAITGHVRRSDGSPLAGAVVRANPQRPAPAASSRRGTVPPSLPLEEKFRRAAEWAKWNAATEREAVTDAAGAFSVTDLSDLPCGVSAWAEGFEVRLAPGVPTSQVKPGGTIEFVATALLDVPVSVLLPDGSVPTEKVRVQWGLPNRGGGGRSSDWTAADPVLQVDEGTWDLTADAGPDVRSRPVAVKLVHGGPVEPVVLRLETRNAIRGAVRFDAADAGWEYVDLRATRRGAPEGVRELRSSARPPDWAFRFEDVVAGDYDLVAALDSRSPVATMLVRVAGGPVRQDVVLPKLATSLFLEVRVVGPDGASPDADDLSFGIRAVSGNTSTGWGASVRGRRLDGALLVPLPTAEGLRVVSAKASFPDVSAQWTLEVTSKKYGKKVVEFVPGTTTRLDVRFP